MRRAIVWLCAAVLASGCGDDNKPVVTGNSSAPADMALTLSSGDVMTSTGDTRSLTAVVSDNQHVVIAAPAIAWSTNAPSVATVSPTGTGTSATITAVDDGTATITATSGAIAKTITVTVHRRLASVMLSAPSSDLVFGSSMQLTPIGLDARQHAIAGLTGFTFNSDNTVTVVVSPDGVVTALFQLPQELTATITATLTRDGVTASGTTGISVHGPSSFSHAALMLTDYEVPNPIQDIGAGVAYFTRVGDRMDYRITWSALTGPATSVHLHGPGDFSQIADVLVDIGQAPQTNRYGAVFGSFTSADIRAKGAQPPISFDSLATLLCNRNAYLDVHTATNAAGEIRGQTFCR